jgi:hypothetical protein
MGLWMLVTIGLILTHQLGQPNMIGQSQATQLGAAIAQVPPPEFPSNPIPSVSPTSSPIIDPEAPSPTPLVPTPSATPTLPPASIAPPPPLPLPAVTPLPLSGMYQDAGNRFKVGILKGYNLTSLASSVLVEAPDGSLSYTVALQPQALVNATLDSFRASDSLTQSAQTFFQRGEGFKPGFAQPIAPSGIQLEWTGALTIAGKTQPISGVILARAAGQDALLLLIAATETGKAQLPNAIVALANSFEVLY